MRTDPKRTPAARALTLERRAARAAKYAPAGSHLTKLCEPPTRIAPLSRSSTGIVQ